VTPIVASYVLWQAWVISWLAAAIWSRRTQSRPPSASRLLDLIPTAIGALLLFLGAGAVARPRFFEVDEDRLWSLPEGVKWVGVAVVASGMAFTWWARLTLGDLWSGQVSRKEGHVVIETGPYRLVRHPIYAGMLVAVWALAIQLGVAVGLIGAALMTFGFWMKARLEERFLSAELGEAAYGDYRRRTPMLMPFWPTRR
jgi:protein-S-isoprenylcysteine O-methyltransferase Ste14